MSAQTSIFGAAADGGNGADVGGQQPRPSVSRSGKSLLAAQRRAGSGHGQFIELVGDVKCGQRVVRLETCKRGHEAPHEFVCVQASGPRVWEMTCTECRRERRELEGA